MKLTNRELLILTMIANGHSAPYIARSLHLGGQTVKNILASIRDKMGVHTITHAVVIAFRLGLIE